ncbi:MAG: hypothetical protein KDA69_00895 [Planctomycetaceae bacterium]|nr:hypothetical protein [Planctomycetaceae bacterium]
MMWRNIRGTMVWMLLIAVGVAVAGGVYLARILPQTDAVIARMVREKLEENAPDWFVDFSDLKFDTSGELWLYDLTVRPKTGPDNVDMLSVPVVRVDLDSDLLLQEQRVVVRHIHLQEPRCVLFRSSDGTWSFQLASPPIKTSDVSAKVTIENGSAVFGIQQPDQSTITEVLVSSIETTSLPLAYRRYRTSGTCTVDGFGALTLQGLFDANTGEWHVAGNTESLQISDESLLKVASLVPGGKGRIGQLGIREQTHAFHDSPVRIASNGSMVPIRSSTPVPVIRMDSKLDFSIGQRQRGGLLDYKLTADVKRGQLSEALIPIPLYDLSANVELAPNRVVVRNLNAANGDSRLYVDGELQRVQGVWRKAFELRATQLRIDERIVRFMPAKMQELYAEVRPAGLFNLNLSLGHDGISKPEVSCEFKAIDCSAQFALMPYPVHGVQGDISKEGELYRVNLKGLAGQHPVSMEGYIIPDGIQTDSKLVIRSSGIPIDEQLLQALNTPKLEEARKTIESLGLTGNGDITAEFLRRPGIDDSYKIRTSIALRDGSVSFQEFPFPLTSLSGRMSYDPLKQDAFVFTDMEARHGDAIIKAEGVFDKTNEPGRLALQMELLNIPIDSDLRRATIIANPGLETIWTDYGLDGDVDVSRVEIGWIPGEKPLISLYGMQWKNGRLKPKALPFGWEDISGSLQWANNRLTIHSLHGFHDDTYLNIDGSTDGASAYIETEVNNELEWHVHFDSMKLMRLKATDEVRHALPESVKKVIEQIDIQGPMNLQLGLDLKGWRQQDLVTAEWSSLLDLNGNQLTTGLELNDVTGQIRILRGTWNGHEANADGYVELDSARILDIPLTTIRGPFHVEGNDILVGAPSPEAASRFLENNRYRDKKLTANVFGGRVGLQATVLMAPEDLDRLQYRVDVKLQDAELAEFAREKGVQEQRLSGKVNGEAVLTGMGISRTATIGEGWIHITPAQLFELPVFAQMFSLIQFREPSDTAFNWAYGDFEIRDGIIDFSTIELYGQSLNLGGRGWVGYAGPNESRLALDFYTQGKRKFLQPLTDRWVRIQVGGTVDNPQPVIQTRIPVLNDAFEGFMRAVDSGQMPSAPRKRQLPPLSQQPNAARQAVPR